MDDLTAQLESTLHIHTAEDVRRVRAQLAKLVFAGDRPRDMAIEEVTAGQIAFDGPYGMRYVAGYYRSKGKRALIYCEGHAGHYRHSSEAIGAFLNHGWDVIAMAMPLYEPNSAGSWEGRSLTSHEDFAQLPTPIEPFVFPWMVLCDYATGAYEQTAIAGVSGGGWSASLYAAIDERVKLSIPVAGVWPRILRGAAEIGDFEQQYDPLYQIASYMDRFVLASVGRKQVQVFNRFDPACFAGDAALQYVPLIQDRLKEIGLGGEFEVLIDETHKDHKCSEWAVEHICRS